MSPLTTGDDGQAKGNKGGATTVAHSIKLSELIVHKFSEGDALMKKAHRIAQDMINEDLREGEYFRSTKQGHFQLVFPKLTRDAGQLRCSVLRDRIYRAIKEINPAAQELAGKNADAGPEPESAVPPRKSVATAAAAKPASAKVKNATADVDEAKKQDADLRHQADEAMRMMAGSVPWRLEELLAKAAGFVTPDTLNLKFHPVWATGKKHVTAYRVSAVPDDTCGAMETGFARQIVDILTLERMGPTLQQMMAIGTPAAMITQIHFATLETGQMRAPLLEALSAQPELFRRFLVCDVVGIPRETSRFRLREVVGYLKGRCRSVSARVALAQPDLEHYANLGFSPVGISWNEYLGNEGRLMAGLDRLADAAAKFGLPIYVCDVSTRSGLLAAVGAGCSYIDGPALHKPFDSPVGIKRFEMGDLYSREMVVMKAVTESMVGPMAVS